MICQTALNQFTHAKSFSSAVKEGEEREAAKKSKIRIERIEKDKGR
jgi:hypothetical protein